MSYRAHENMSGVATENQSSFYEALESAQMSAFWKVIPNLPKDVQRSYLWKWSEVEPLLRQAGDLVTAEEAERRVLLFSDQTNPASTTPTLTASLQLVLPGELAPSHRHTMAAIRLIISGSGAFTDVEGQRITMEPNDLILTPSWNWHNHANETEEPIIWLDGLDSPLVRALRADLFEPDRAGQQTLTKEPEYTRRLVGNGLVRPAGVSLPANPLPVIYRWSEVYPELLDRAGEKGSPFDGVILEYINPITGGSALPTMACNLQLLRKGEETRTHRHRGSVVYRVLRGEGYSIIDGNRVEWGDGDVFSLPSWVWHSHANVGEREAILFSFTDAPVMQTLGLYSEEEQ